MGVHDKIKEIEEEIARTQKNKATNAHLGALKARIAKLRSELLLEGSAGKAGPSEGFAVERSGDARVALIGFPSVGKSSLLSELTDTESLAAGCDARNAHTAHHLCAAPHTRGARACRPRVRESVPVDAYLVVGTNSQRSHASRATSCTMARKSSCSISLG